MTIILQKTMLKSYFVTFKSVPKEKKSKSNNSHIHNPTATLKEWLELPSNYILFLWYTFMIHMRAILSSHKNIKTRLPDFSLTSFLLSYPWLLIQTSPPTHIKTWNTQKNISRNIFLGYLIILNNALNGITNPIFCREDKNELDMRKYISLTFWLSPTYINFKDTSLT